MANETMEVFYLNQLWLDKEDRVSHTQSCYDSYLPSGGMIPFICTKEHGHTGDHCAHNLDGNIVARWPAQATKIASEG